MSYVRLFTQHVAVSKRAETAINGYGPNCTANCYRSVDLVPEKDCERSVVSRAEQDENARLTCIAITNNSGRPVDGVCFGDIVIQLKTKMNFWM